MRLNEVGQLAETEWLRTARLRAYLVQDAFVVMPNHVHLLFGLMEGESHTGDINHTDGSEPDRRDMARHIPTPPGTTAQHEGGTPAEPGPTGVPPR